MLPLLDDVTEGSSRYSLVAAVPSSKGVGLAGVNPAWHGVDGHNGCRPRSCTRDHYFVILTGTARLYPPAPIEPYKLLHLDGADEKKDKKRNSMDERATRLAAWKEYLCIVFMN